MKDGVHMLRASTPSTFRVRIPGNLPNDFTLEFDLIPKNCCNPEDLAFEGTPNIRQDEASAYVLWHRDHQRVIGGVKDESYDKPMPPALSAVVPGAMTTVAASLEGTTLRMFTNGTPVYSLTRAFARGQVLRVFLGGQNARDHGRDEPVYLAKMRIGAGPPAAVAAGAPAPSALNQSSNPLPNAGSGGGTAGSTNALGTTIVQNVSVTLGANGPIVNWQHGTAPSIFTVQRWKADDPACCNNTSPASPPLTAPPWQDSPPLLSGTYTYRVTATSSDGSAMAGTNFVYTRGTTRGTIVGSGPSPGLTSPFTVTVTMGTNGPVVTWPTFTEATGYRASRSHIDDLNCCNTSTGLRTYGATPPWQDQPLPRSGTYLYQVVANTPNGQVIAETHFTFRMAGEGTEPTPVTAIVAVPPTGTIVAQQPDPLERSPVTSATSVTPVTGGTAAASTDFRVATPSPTSTKFGFATVSGAVGYRIRRSVAGSVNWVDVTTTPIPASVGGAAVSPFLYPDLVDSPLDHRQTYTYELQAVQPDGTYGTTLLNHTPPGPRDPAGFRATVTGPGQVLLEWEPVPLVKTFRVNGPGTGVGISVAGPASHLTLGKYTLTGLPVGSHTWTIASIYETGVLTAAAAWPTATIAVAAPDPAPRYRLVALGFRADQQSTDTDNARDGAGDEIYLSAIINQANLTGLPLPVVKNANLSMVVTRSHGSEAVSVPYGRIRSGTASAMGGIRTGDMVPATLDPAGPTPPLLANQFPILLWEGSLEGDAVTVVHLALWEDDVNPLVQAHWASLIFSEAGNLYQPQTDARYETAYVVDDRTYQSSAEIFERSNGIGNFSTPFVYKESAPTRYQNGSVLFQCTTILGILVRRPCEAHGVDRPIGLEGGSHPGYWFDRLLVLTKAGVEDALAVRGSTYAVVPGTFVMQLDDDVGTPTEATAKYRLYLRLERVP
jgi:hypothetical protein